MARVLYVSKPITPPFHDGSKCLVRDVAQHLSGHEPEIMTIAGAPEVRGVAGPVRSHDVYSNSGAFTPALRDNLSAACWLATRARADLWHYVFAPNPRTSALGRWLRCLRGRPVLQTVASAPRRFDGVSRLLFGDIVVAQSQHTASRIAEAYEQERVPDSIRKRVEVIPPPVPALAQPSGAELERARAELGVGPRERVILFPGDLETGGGAERVAQAVRPLISAIEDAVVVFAYRAKSPRAAEVAERLGSSLAGLPVRLSGTVAHMHALLAISSAVIFPVDDLWGKVDLPIVLLEAMRLGVPVVVLDRGPLSELEGARRVASTDAAAWVQATAPLVISGPERDAVTARQREAVVQHYSADVVARRYSLLYDELSAPTH